MLWVPALIRQNCLHDSRKENHRIKMLKRLTSVLSIWRLGIPLNGEYRIDFEASDASLTNRYQSRDHEWFQPSQSASVMLWTPHPRLREHIGGTSHTGGTCPGPSASGHRKHQETRKPNQNNNIKAKRDVLNVYFQAESPGTS